MEISRGYFVAYAVMNTTDSFKDQQLNSFLESPYEGIVIFDNKKQIIFANQVCYQFFKCLSTSELGDELAALLPHTSLSHTFEKGKPLSGELVTVRGKQLELIYLPIIRNKQTVGIIVKSHPYVREEHNWGTVVEAYKTGTAKYYIDHIVGEEPNIVKQKELAIRAARTVSTILITGESGTGKEIFAHAVHNLSDRRKGPFVRVNCAAVPETLLESELFGYAEGAFTGARKEGKPGKFELANQGSIFLDEIGDMFLSMQAKLLRVLQEKEVERVGGIHTTPVNVRVIAASNQNLSQMVEQGEFRKDLFYRLNVIVLTIPPLRERKNDIPLLCKTLFNRLNHTLHSSVNDISAEVMEAFINYSWPGNIRELENTLERAINFCDGSRIFAEHIPTRIINQPNMQVTMTGSLEQLMEEHEKQIVASMLDKCNGNRTKAAEMLGIHRSVLYRKINKYEITS
ncbi:MAG: sigma 54-interacting transcriptional regulator [Bacillota bacterium]|nr:sigma 54-interacting transcriptional regulator [Bacillota bacterium]